MNARPFQALGGLALSLALAACGQPAAKGSTLPAASPTGLTKIAVGYPNFRSAHIPLWVAKEAGIFEQNGIDADLRNLGGTVTNDSIVAGDTQFCSCNGAVAVNADAAGSDLVIIATLLPVADTVLQAAPGIKTAADLKGKKVGISGLGQAGEITVKIALKQLGLDPNKDVTLLSVGSVAHEVPAFEGGAIQAALTSPPDSLVLETKGFNTLVRLADLKLSTASASVTVQRSWLSAHHDLAQKYVDSLMQATAKAKRDKAFTMDVLRKYQKQDDESLLNATYDLYVGKLLSSLPYPATEQLTDAVNELATTNAKAPSLDLNRLIDTSFVKSAADRGLDR